MDKLSNSCSVVCQGAGINPKFDTKLPVHILKADEGEINTIKLFKTISASVCNEYMATAGSPISCTTHLNKRTLSDACLAPSANDPYKWKALAGNELFPLTYWHVHFTGNHSNTVR